MIGRRLFDLTNGWDGKPAAYEHVFVVTHRAPTDWEHVGTAPFTFVDRVEEAIAAAWEFAADSDVDVAGGHCQSHCGWRTRPRSCTATASPISSTTSAAEAGSTAATGCDRMAPL